MNDLFGDEIREAPPPARGIIQKRKALLKYRAGTAAQCCGNCANHIKTDHHYKTYHKCALVGMSHSTATDIRLKCVCDCWEGKCNDGKHKKENTCRRE